MDGTVDAAPDLKKSRLRYIERAIKFGAIVLVTQGLVWCGFFILADVPVGVALHSLFVFAGIALFLLAKHGDRKLVLHCAFWVLFTYCISVLISFDSGSNGWQRVTHLYLLPIALSVSLLFIDEPPMWRYVYPGLCVFGLVVIERNLVDLPTLVIAPPLENTRHIGVPFNAAIAVGLTLLMLRRFAIDVATRESFLANVNSTIEGLLERMLPGKILQRLRDDHAKFADEHEHVTIMFADIVGFTRLASEKDPQSLVNLLNRVFSRFDELVETHGVEKIKTIGDAYMAVAGIPERRPDHALAITRLAVDMQEVMKDFPELKIRIGINTGRVIAGIIGRKRFIYDLWGDAVNLASCMESTGSPSRIHVSESTARELAAHYQLESAETLPGSQEPLMPSFFVGSPITGDAGV